MMRQPSTSGPELAAISRNTPRSRRCSRAPN